MNETNMNNPRMQKSKRRRGLMMTELIVAATLLIAALTLISTLSFRTGKLWQDSRHYRLASEELGNQLERLTVLDESELDAELANLEASPAAQAALQNPRLVGEKIVDSDGTRIKLSINWDRAAKAAPLVLIGWLTPTGEVEP